MGISRTSRKNYIDVDILANFFERIALFKKPKDFGISITTYYEKDFEIFKIFMQELFLYTITVGIKNNNWNLIADLLYASYYFNYGNGRNAALEKFHELYSHCDTLQNYYKELHNKISGFGEYVITNLSNKVSKNEIIFADLLFHYISELDSKIIKNGFQEFMFIRMNILN